MQYPVAGKPILRSEMIKTGVNLNYKIHEKTRPDHWNY